MSAALRAKRVDAISIVEPFLTDLIASTPVNILAGANVSIQPNLPFATIIMRKEYVEEYPSVVRRFQLALRRTLQYVAANPQAIRAVLPTFSGIPSDVAAKVKLGKIQTTLNMSGIQRLADELFEYGFLKKRVNMKKSVIAFPLPPPKKK